MTRKNATLGSLALLAALGGGGLLAASSESKLLPSQTSAGDRYGLTVAISGDTAAVVSPFEEYVDAQNPGGHFVYVFGKGGAGWTAKQTLALAPSFVWGYDAPLAMRGNTLAVGTGVAIGSGGDTIGTVKVFERPDAASPFGAPISASTSDGAASDSFGSTLALHEDESTMVIGASGAGANAPYLPGAAYVFLRTVAGWTQFTKLTADDGTSFDRFGSSVAIAGDTIVVGAKGEGNSGAAYVFVLVGVPGVWTQMAKLSNVGSVVAVSVDPADATGATKILVAGDPFDGTAGSESGAVRTFVGSGATWTADAAILTAPGAQASDAFGSAVALRGDRLVVGAEHGFDSATKAGEVFVFTRGAGTWVQSDRFEASSQNRRFGRSVDASDGGVIVGAGDDDRPNDPGAAFVYDAGGGGVVVGPKFQWPTLISANPAIAGNAVTLQTRAVPAAPPSKPAAITYEWTFGDGTVQVAGPKVTHTYAAPGTFDAVVRATSADGKFTDSETLTVVLFLRGTAYFDVAKASVALKLNAAGRDKVTIAGQIPLADGTSLAGKVLSVDFGGVTASFTLDAKGKSPKGTSSAKVAAPKGGVAKFSVSLTGAHAAALADEGMTNATVANVDATTHVVVTFDGTPYTEDFVMIYAATANKKGAAK